MARAPRRFLVRYKTSSKAKRWSRLPRFITKATGFRTRAAANAKLDALLAKHPNAVGHVDTYDHLRVIALAAARKLIGVMEHGGNNRGTEVERIILANGGVIGEPWCGDFVALCYREAGSKAVTRAWAAVRLIGRVLGVIVVGKRAGEPGDILRFTFDHTGLLEAYCDSRGNEIDAAFASHVKTIEGNTGATGAVSDSVTGGDGVYRKVRPLSQVQDICIVTK